MTLVATIAGFITLLFWGAGDYFTGKSGQKGNAYLTNLIVQTASLLIFTPIMFWHGFYLPDAKELALTALVAAMFTLAFISFVKALSIGPFGVASPLSNSYSFITLVISIIFLGFQISQIKLLVLVSIILGVMLLAIDRTTFHIRSFHGSTVYFSLFTAVLWGIGFSIADIILKELTWYQFLFFINLFTVIFGFLYYRKALGSFPDWREFQYRYAPEAWLAGLLLTVGSASLFMATEYTGSVVVPAVIGSAAPLVTSLIARVTDREQLSTFKRLGAFLVVIGLMLLNIL